MIGFLEEKVIDVKDIRSTIGTTINRINPKKMDDQQKSRRKSETAEAVSFFAQKSERRAAVRTRTKPIRYYTWEDYGITREQYGRLKSFCQNPQNWGKVFRIAEKTDALTAEQIALSVSRNLSYEGVEALCARKGKRIPVCRTDFYGYRRRFYALLQQSGTTA